MTDIAPAILEADEAQIVRFVDALFRYADPDSIVALRKAPGAAEAADNDPTAALGAA